MQVHNFDHNNKTLEYLAKTNSRNTAVILFHGYGASMYDLYDLSQVNDDFDWYFPQGVPSLFGNMSRAWFPIDEQALQSAMMAGTHRDLSDTEPEGLEESLELTGAFLKSLEYERIIIGGFSQGAMLTSHLLYEMENKLAAAVLFSGNTIHKKKLSKSLGQMNSSLPIFQSHGRQDPILGYDGAVQLQEILKAAGHKVELYSFDGQHEIPMVILRSWSDFMQRFA